MAGPGAYRGDAGALARPGAVWVEPTFLEIAEQIAEAASDEARRTAAMIATARRCGLSQQAIDIAVDDARGRYDKLVRGHQIMFALVAREAKVRLLIETGIWPDR